MRQGPQLLDGFLDALAQLVEDLSRRLGVGLGQLAGEAHVDGQGHQVLLGPVVEVALDLAPGRVGRGHDAGPRRPQLVGLAPDLVERFLEGGVELDVVQRQADLTGELGEHGVVVGRELVAVGRPHRHDEPEDLARVRRGRDAEHGVLASRQQARQPDLHPRRARDPGAGHDRRPPRR